MRKRDILDWIAPRNATTGQIARKFGERKTEQVAGEKEGTEETKRKKFSRWLNKQRRYKRVRARGLVSMRETGRPSITWGKACPQKELEHEVWVTEAELDLDVEFQRHVRVGSAFADGWFFKDGIPYFVEVDNHTMTRKQMRQKWERYGKIDGFILVLCHTKRRMRRLMQSAETMKDCVLFSLFRWIKFENVGRKWIDLTLKRVEV